MESVGWGWNDVGEEGKRGSAATLKIEHKASKQSKRNERKSMP